MQAPYKFVRDEYGNHRLEHRVVVEKHIGRKLKRNEHIHHINGDKNFLGYILWLSLIHILQKLYETPNI